MIIHEIEVKFSENGTLQCQKEVGTIVQRNNLVNRIAVYFKTKETDMATYLSDYGAIHYKLYCKLPTGDVILLPSVLNEGGSKTIDTTYFSDGYGKVTFDIDARVTLYKGTIECTLTCSQDADMTWKDDDGEDYDVYYTDNFRPFNIRCEQSANPTDVVPEDETDVWNSLLEFETNNASKLNILRQDKGINRFLNGTGNYTWNWYYNDYDLTDHPYAIVNPSVTQAGYNSGNAFHPTIYNCGEFEQTGKASFKETHFTSEHTFTEGLVDVATENYNKVLVTDNTTMMHTLSTADFIEALGLAKESDLNAEVTARENADTNVNAQSLARYNTLNAKIDSTAEEINETIDENYDDLDSKITDEKNSRETTDASLTSRMSNVESVASSNTTTVTNLSNEVTSHLNSSKSMLLSDVTSEVNDETGALVQKFSFSDGSYQTVTTDLGLYLTRVTDAIDIYADTSPTTPTESRVKAIKLGANNTIEFVSDNFAYVRVNNAPSIYYYCNVIYNELTNSITLYSTDTSHDGYVYISFVTNETVDLATWYLGFDKVSDYSSEQYSGTQVAFVGEAGTLFKLANGGGTLEQDVEDFDGVVTIMFRIAKGLGSVTFSHITLTKGSTKPSYTMPGYNGVLSIPLLNYNDLTDYIHIVEDGNYLTINRIGYNWQWNFLPSTSTTWAFAGAISTSPTTTEYYSKVANFDLQTINSASVTLMDSSTPAPIIKFTERGQRYADIPLIDRYNPPYMNGDDLIITWNGGYTTSVDMSYLIGDTLHKDTDTIHFAITENHEIYANVIEKSLDETYFTESFNEAIANANTIYQNESARQVAETTRQANETARIKAETDRESAEQSRASAEASRSAEFNGNEADRQATFEANEEARNTAEATRQSEFETLYNNMLNYDTYEESDLEAYWKGR